MKRQLLASLALLSITSVSLAKPSDAQYFAYAISGSWPGSKVGFTAIRQAYPGYAKCNREKFTDFADRNAQGFAAALNDQFRNQFPNTPIIPNMIRLVGNTPEEVHEQWKAWMKKETQSGHRVELVSFNARCL
jgi:hypothetical protein